MVIDRKQVSEDTRRIEELSKAAIVEAVPFKTDAARLGCALTALIIDGYSAVVALLGTAGEYHAPTIVRTMFEAYADFLTLAKEPEYEQRMKLHAAIERKKVLEGYMAVYAGQPGSVATAKGLQTLEQTIKRLKDAGVTGYTIKERFRSAGLDGQKAYIYGELLPFAHADYVAIMLRHYKRGEILLGDALPDEWFAKVVFLSSTILLDVLIKLPAFATIDAANLRHLRGKAITHYERLPLVDKLKGDHRASPPDL